MEEKAVNLKNKLKKQGVRGLALDIDETLSLTNSHWFDHMLDFHNPEGLSKEELIQKYMYVEEVPSWQTEEAAKHMETILHSNEFNETISLIEGADKAVRKINEIVPIAAYITARPATVVEGTLRWLKKHDFPEAELITRPQELVLSDFNLNKNKWKAGVLDFLYPEIIGIVDDNPVLAHQLEILGYKGKQYLYGPQVQEFKGGQNVVVCPTWDDVVGSVNAV